ncbi:MAG: lysine 2,3-aminomutase [Vicinamibacteria bacterium]|nr:lysine 2,3-aminomutase [Vicinamibacteria bacterium]
MSFSNVNQNRIAAEIVDRTSGPQRWTDYRWQLKHSIRDIDTFSRLTGIIFPSDRRERLEQTLKKFPLSITPYYLSLIDRDDYKNDPVFKQSFPDIRELQISRYDMHDPLFEDRDSPVKGITHRYPDRVLMLLNSTCSMYCRHCTRKRQVGDPEAVLTHEEIEAALDYIRDVQQIRDVLLSGGDPLMLDDSFLDWILGRLRQIPHVEVIRIGSRMPAVLPYRVTDQLVQTLRKHHPLWLNTHFNHPCELNPPASAALARLADAGIPLGNQTVLLAGVNDCPRIMRRLFHKLVQNRVRPYYLYQCDMSEGLSHFRTPVGKGIEIIESLIGHTSGFAVPTYVIDAPGGGGKIPVMPNYLISWSTNKVVLRNYEGVITTYKEPDSYEPIFCDRNCNECRLQLDLDDAEEYNVTGIEKLLSDFDDAVSFTPAHTDRLERQEQREREHE